MSIGVRKVKVIIIELKGFFGKMRSKSKSQGQSQNLIVKVNIHGQSQSQHIMGKIKLLIWKHKNPKLELKPSEN